MPNTEYKIRKKAYKKALKQNGKPFKGLSVLTGIIAGIMLPTSIIVSMFDNTIAIATGDQFWELVNPDANAQYFTSDFASVEAMIAEGDRVVKEVEKEGASLLINNKVGKKKALPLAKESKVSLFSTSSVNVVYGGTGSANVDASKCDNLKQALEKSNVNLKVNPTLWDFYTTGPGSKYKRSGSATVTLVGASVAEAPRSSYTTEVLDSVKEYGDAAIVVLSRVGGEGSDLVLNDQVNYLSLNKDEKDMMAMIKQLKDNGSVKEIVVLINSANPLQVDFLKDNTYGVDACMWIGDPGATGLNGVAELLVAADGSNPSGGLVDTYCYDNLSSPAMQNNEAVSYLGDLSLIPSDASTYMVYQEGIYVGYKYYETRYEDYVMNTGNAGQYAYSDDVAFPFGYGLSYSEFEFTSMSTTYNTSKDVYEIEVAVKNVGDVAGKEIVQIYGQAPYTQYDIEKGVEKAAVQLVGFGKTSVLEPGKSETVKIEVERRELASYDTYGEGSYIFEEGNYYLAAAKDAHEGVNNILAAKGYTPSSTSNRMDKEGNSKLVYKDVIDSTEAKAATKAYQVSFAGVEIENHLQSADIKLYDGIKEGQDVTYLTRNNWVGTFPSENNKVQLELTEKMIKDLQNVLYNAEEYNGRYAGKEMPKMAQEGDVTLYDLIGKDYDDPLWEKLLDQVTFDEMVALIGDAFHWTMPLKSIEAPGTRNENGPQGLTASLFGNGSETAMKATALTSEDVMAATFNVELVAQVGNIVGNNCLAANVNVLYGPGNNMHRTPYGGRNFEYYSEDAFLSAMIGTYEVKAIQAKGVHVVMKHFALNDSEKDRIGLGVWLNEQAAREIYLKAFQMPFEKGDANGVMTAYTRWGCVWSGGHYGLMTEIMREEWGSEGLSITDNILTNYTNGVDAILAGVSIFDAMLPNVVNQLPQYKDDPVVVNAMREATHRNLYAIVNSCGVNGLGKDTTINVVAPKIVTTVITATVISWVLFITFLTFLILRRVKFHKTVEYLSFKEYKASLKKNKK